jgi:predicted PurR-regulated permease PerM
MDLEAFPRARPSDDDRDPNGAQQLTGTYIELALRLSALALILYWSLVLVRPFIAIIAWSVILAVSLHPTFTRAVVLLHGRRRLAAAVVTTACLLMVVAPTAWIALGVLEALRSLSEQLETGNISVPAPAESVKRWPVVGDPVFQFWQLAFTNLKGAVQELVPYLKPLGTKLLGMAGNVGTGILEFLVSVIVAGLLLSSGPSLAAAIRQFSRKIDADRGERFIEMAGATIRTVSRGVIGISLLQACLAGIGLFIAGVPGASLITFAVLVLGIIQIGPAFVLIPVIIWSWTAMDSGAALLFTAYMVPVNFLDNVLKPIVMGRGLTTPLPVILIGVIGGTIAHGIVGLFLGPIVLAVTWELLMAWSQDRSPAAAVQVTRENGQSAYTPR